MTEPIIRIRQCSPLRPVLSDPRLRLLRTPRVHPRARLWSGGDVPNDVRRANDVAFDAETPPVAVATAWEPTISPGGARWRIVFFHRVVSRTANAIADQVRVDQRSW